MLYHIGWLYVNGAQQLAAQGDGLHGSCVNLWMDISEGRIEDIPSGKHTKNYRTSQFLMGKSTTNDHFQQPC